MRLYDTVNTANTMSTMSIADSVNTGDTGDGVEFGRLWCGIARNTLSRSGVGISDFGLTDTIFQWAFKSW